MYRQKTSIGALFALLAFLCVPLAHAQTDFWRAVDGPYGGVSVSDVVRHDGDLVAATNSGAFRSSDGGLSWASASEGLAQPDIRDLHVLLDGTLMAATWGDGMYQWDDGQGAWTRWALPTTFMAAITQTVTGRIVIATNAGVRFTDDGVSWQSVSLDGIQAVPDALASSETHVFVGTSVGVFRSSNNALTWTYASFGMQEFDVHALTTNAEGHVFAGVTPVNGGCSLYRSRGSGNLWTCVQPVTDPILVRSLAVGADGRVMAGGFKNVFASTNGGDTWSARPAAPTTIEALVEVEPGTWLAGSAGAGMTRSGDNGFTWTTSNDGLFSPVRDLLLDGARVYAATGGGIFMTENQGGTWRRVQEFEPLIQDVRKMALDQEGRLLAGTTGGLWRLDTAATDADGDPVPWEFLGPSNRPRVGALTVGPDGDIWIGFHSGVQLYNGSFWSPMFIQGDDGAYRDVSSLAVLDDGSVIAGAAYDSWRLEPGSTVWSLMSTPTLAWFDFQSIAFDGFRILIGTRFSGVLESVDGGRSWDIAAYGLGGSEDVQDITFDRFGNPFIGTFGSGVFQLHPFTKRWEAANSGLDGHLRIRTIAFGQDGAGWVGTVDGGLYAHGISGVATESLPERTLGGHALSIFPNPATGSASVEWGNPSQVPMRLEVFDLLGRRVLTQDVPSGSADIRLDGLAGLPSGSYLVRLSGDKTVRSGAVVKM